MISPKTINNHPLNYAYYEKIHPFPFINSLPVYNFLAKCIGPLAPLQLVPWEHATFVSGFKSKLTYFIHTILHISEVLLPLSDKNLFQLSQVFKFALTTKEYCHHYHHGTDDWIYHSFMKQRILNIKIPG